MDTMACLAGILSVKTDNIQFVGKLGELCDDYVPIKSEKLQPLASCDGVTTMTLTGSAGALMNRCTPSPSSADDTRDSAESDSNISTSSHDQENSETIRTPGTGASSGKLEKSGTKQKPQQMSRRNARERNRVRFLNMTFEVLRQHLPLHKGGVQKGKNKKLSKVDTLRGAIGYIRELQDLLGDSDAVDAALQACDPSSVHQFVEPGLLSPVGSQSSGGSTTPSSSHTDLTSDEDDLLDMTAWFTC